MLAKHDFLNANINKRKKASKFVLNPSKFATLKSDQSSIDYMCEDTSTVFWSTRIILMYK
jgi:hypothetical protein